ncbi:hypothetical protein SXCC_02163 [Gluconacetobacter sp. SXCC-1]|nr:hypothetical protein SXCC_02163 [Gluconacetobacter sp. SXCC-1]
MAVSGMDNGDGWQDRRGGPRDAARICWMMVVLSSGIIPVSVNGTASNVKGSALHPATGGTLPFPRSGMPPPGRTRHVPGECRMRLAGQTRMDGGGRPWHMVVRAGGRRG